MKTSDIILELISEIEKEEQADALSNIKERLRLNLNNYLQNLNLSFTQLVKVPGKKQLVKELGRVGNKRLKRNSRSN